MKYPCAPLKFRHGEAEIFGQYYVGSNNQRKNALKRKQLAKRK